MIHHAAEAALTADFTPAGKAPEDYRLIAQTILDSYLMTGPTQLPARKDLYLEVAEAVLQRSIHLTQARLEARQLPAIEVTTGGLAEDTGEGTVNKALGETLDAGVRAFWHHADQLRDLRERNRPGYEDPFLLRWFAGRTVLEIVLLLELPQSSVEGRIAYIETETGFPSAPKTPQAIGAT